ncbi:MAG TPA: argininosuccinate lyase, partial [Methanosarcinales archaeon]|nr:argininosuccinate lyase [Methanosarcinales archaeon]
SIMPQKKNPDVAELIRGKTGSTVAALVGILTITKALPQSYNRDLQEATAHLWSAAADTLASVCMTAGMIDTMKMHEETLARQATAGFAMATELADTLVRRCGISFRTAHQIVGTLARMDAVPSLWTIDETCFSMTGRRLSDSGLDEQAITDALDPVSEIGSRASGGPAPGDVARVITIFENELQKDLIALDVRCNRVNDAARMLDHEVRRRTRMISVV